MKRPTETTTFDRWTALFARLGLVLLLTTVAPPASAQEAEGTGAAPGTSVKACCQNCAKMKGEHEKSGDMQCGHMQKGHMNGGHMQGDTKGMRHGASGGERGMGGHRQLMVNIHGLINDHSSITREVEKIADGVVTVTRTSNPELVPTLQTHVAQMYGLIDSGGSIRHWDPLFVEIFEHADQIVMDTELLEDGIRVRETSADPYVVKLIQAHADKVNEFVARGMDAMHEPTAVPER